ncbi:MAG: hypothetical protein E7614_06375 [Ruminococcaceae bacterium]|nr:hypothetical protein [Oscillospiraceae bacterium]
MDKEKTLRCGALVAFEIFAVVTIITLIANKQYDRLPLAIATPLILLVPKFAEQIFKCKIVLPVYLISLFYAIGPMLGHCHNFYYTIPWWDKMLHILGGVMFAFFGLFLFEKYVGNNKKKVVMTAIFALCFSMAISVLWEFCEYGADTFFGMDMQDDVVIHRINSYLLDDEVGIAGSIDEIEEVLVNGKTLPVAGYIDIGLNDTMMDMLLETLGAVVVAVVYIIGKGKFNVFKNKEQKT